MASEKVWQSGIMGQHLEDGLKKKKKEKSYVHDKKKFTAEYRMGDLA